MKFREYLDNLVLLEEEGGELFRFNGYVFYIAGRTEGKIPHIHFRKSEKLGAIRLDIAEYFPHGNPLKYTSELSKKNQLLFYSFMSAKQSKVNIQGINTNYQLAIYLWNMIPDGLKLNIDNEMPDYRELKMP